jgi:FkbM family methyltransferase
MTDSEAALSLNGLATIITQQHRPLTFTLIEIGARPVEGQQEPFHAILDAFPGSRVVAFELDEELCAELNRKANPGVQFYPAALGRRSEIRTLYRTVDPVCTSLYEPNAEFLKLYNNLEVAMLESTETVSTISLDEFTAAQGIERVDFIKIDIQGAELDVLEGAPRALEETLAIVSEVEFVPIYLDQPLFGDVCAFLDARSLMFGRFLNMGGRSLKPMMIDNDPNYRSQYMWADALFTRKLGALRALPPEAWLRLGVLMTVYGSHDLAFFCFDLFDTQNSTNICMARYGFSGRE